MRDEAGNVSQLLDSLDRNIIEQLRKDGRMSFSEIARQVGKTEVTVRQRYNRLVSLGVIFVTGMTDETKIGRIAAHVGIRVAKVPVAQVAKQLAEHPQVKYAACTLGYYDILLDVTADDTQELGEIVLQDLRRVRGVQEVETLTVLQVRKDSYEWQGFKSNSL